MEYYIDFKKICDQFKDAIYIADKIGTTIYVNDAYVKMTGKSKTDFIGKNVYDINKEGILYKNGIIPSILKTKKSNVAIGEITVKGKRVFMTGMPIFDDSGQLEYAVAMDMDINRLETINQFIDQLKNTVEKTKAEIKYLRDYNMGMIKPVTKSQNMKDVIITVNAVANTDVTVLISGKSGTGKEVVAESIYFNSKRQGQPYITLNCSAIPPSLLESELFGYEAGAFTGADPKGKPGYFELANNGTLFLDEIGELPIDLQPKLLRVLQSKEVNRVGGKKPIPFDVRIIAATNKDLIEEVEKGNFRSDLFYRLNVVPINLAPLKDRLEDIPELTTHFLERYNNKYNKKVKIKPDIFDILYKYDWPGNIRELKNILERLVVINNNGDISSETMANSLCLNVNNHEAISNININNNLKQMVSEYEKRIILKQLEISGTKRKAAKALGLNHSTLIKKCQKLGI